MRNAFAGCALALAALAAHAQDVYPSRPITMIVPFAAGGAYDIVGRIIAPRMGELLGQPIVIENVIHFMIVIATTISEIPEMLMGIGSRKEVDR